MAVTNQEVMEKIEKMQDDQEKMAEVLRYIAKLMPSKESLSSAAETDKKDYFSILNQTNVNDHTEQKNGLTYLSWAWAWAEVKKVCPDATFTIYERQTEYGPCNYFTDGKTCWVKTGATVGGIEYIEELPVMDFKNKSIQLSAVTSMDVNKAIQRSLTKAFARHGLGLYIYAGEDLPEESEEEKAARIAKQEAELREQQEIVKLQREIDTILRKMLAGVTPEQKKELINLVVGIVGTQDYKKCLDKAKLSALIDKLNSMNNVA